jgi:diacylglycerol kinase (ATP)
MPEPFRVLLNSHAGGDADGARQAVRLYPGAELIEADDLVASAEQAAREGAGLVVAAGGDGTVHAVANGLMRVGEGAAERPTLGILPMGTGNDLARTLALPLGEPCADGLHLLETGERRAIDAIRVTTGDGSCYAVNACSGGFTDQIGEAMTSELKATWGALAYAIGIVRALPAIEEYHTTIAWGDEEPERVRAFNVLVANGRTIGGGTPVAPGASLEDGLLDVVVVREGGALDIARLTARAYATKDYTKDDKVLFRRVRKLRIASRPGMTFNVDGDPHTREPVTFEVVPSALRVVVGPEYVTYPDSHSGG